MLALGNVLLMTIHRKCVLQEIRVTRKDPEWQTDYYYVRKGLRTNEMSALLCRKPQ